MRESRRAEVVNDGGTVLVDVYICDECGEVSQDARFWVSVSRLGYVTSFGDQLAVDRSFCSMKHAANWCTRTAP